MKQNTAPHESVFRPRWATALALCATLGLSGCKWALNLGVSGDLRAPVFTVASGTPLRRNPCVAWFKVYPEASSGVASWYIASEQMRCVEAAELAYGAAPAEFRTVAPPRPLEPNTIYVAYAAGDGWVGQARFVYRDGRFHTL